MFKELRSVKYLILALVLALIFTVTGCSNNEKSEETVAKIGDVEITKGEFYDILVKQYGEETLDGMISDKIMQLEIKKSNVSIAEEEINEEFKIIENYYGSSESLSQTMESYNMTREEMQKNIKINLSMKKLVAEDIVITDEEIANFYEENVEVFNKAEQVNASHILVDTKELANEVIGKLNAGGSFEDLAIEYSKDSSAAIGGNLGFFSRGDMVEPFDKAAFSLLVGEISEPVQSNFGYHIIRVNEKVEATEGSVEANKDEIKDMILESKIPEAFAGWYEEKLEEYKVINNLKKQ